MRMIDNALTGAVASQAALNAVSQNIANQMTPGYSRQGVVLTALMPGSGDPYSSGSGVVVNAVRRFNDDFKNLQLWQAASSQGELVAQNPYFGQLEQVMGRDGSSLSAGFDQFFQALSAASLSGDAMRDPVIRSAEALAQRFNNLDKVFGSQLSAIAEQRSATVTQINSSVANIADLNAKIAAGKAVDTNTSGLEDERDRQIDSLSALVEVRVVSQPDGSKNVSLKSGLPLVADTQAATLSNTSQPDGSQVLTLNFSKDKYTLAGDGLGGQLGGLNQYEIQTVRPMRAQVKTLASEMAQRVNDQLAKGYDNNGQPGKPLFVYDASGVNGILKTSGITSAELGFSGDPAKPGDNSNLLAVIGLQQQKITMPGVGAVTIGDAYSQMVGKLAVSSKQNKSGLESAKVIRAEAEKSWHNTSGVNRDEEAMDLLEFQKMYQANMKVISVANQLFESTLSIL